MKFTVALGAASFSGENHSCSPSTFVFNGVPVHRSRKQFFPPSEICRASVTTRVSMPISLQRGARRASTSVSRKSPCNLSARREKSLQLSVPANLSTQMTKGEHACNLEAVVKAGGLARLALEFRPEQQRPDSFLSEMEGRKKKREREKRTRTRTRTE